MKVLFLTRYPVEGASSRYRVYQYLPYLAKLGIECHVSSLMSEELYRLAFEAGRHFNKAVYLFPAILRRLQLLVRVDDYDVIFMQRELLPFGPPWIEKLLKRRGAKLIFDYDDALFIFKPSKFNWLASVFRNSEKIFQIFALSDCVLAGNSYLRDIAAQHTEDARVFHVAEDTERIQMRPPHTKKTGLVLGWLGSKTTEQYLELIRQPLEEFFASHRDSRLLVMGGGEFKAPFGVHHLPWSLDGELKALASFDIGLMPLPNEEWSLGKSGGKARTYMAAGVPPVCTAIGYNLELIRHEETGYLVESPSEWADTLGKLAANPDLRQRIGQAARQDVISRFSVQRQAAKLAKILADVSAKPNPPR